VSDTKDALQSSAARDSWVARFATDADAEAILDLLLAAYGSWPAHEIAVPAVEHLRWKLFGRDDVRAWQIVVEDAGRIIGLNAVFRQPISVRGQLRSAYQFVDLAVHPEHQRRGVIPAARRFAVSARVPYGDVLFGPPRVKPGPAAQSTGRSDPALRRNAYLQALVLEGPVAAPPPARQSSWLLQTPSHFDERIRAFSSDAAQPFDLISAHDKEFLNWRYCDRRAGRWTVHTAEEDARLLGYIAYRISGDSAYVGGLLALPDRLDVVESLLGEMMRSLQGQGVPAVQCWTTSSHPYRAVLRDFGLDKKRRYVRLTVHADGEDLSDLEDRTATLHITAADTDLV